MAVPGPAAERVGSDQKAHDSLAHLTSGGVLEEQLELGGIGSQHPQSAPARDAALLDDQGERAIVQEGVKACGENFCRALERARAPTLRVSSACPLEVGKEGIQFIPEAG